MQAEVVKSDCRSWSRMTPLGATLGAARSTMALAGASPSARDRREFHRMGVEKIAAFYESWNAMCLALLRANLNLAVTPFQFWWSPHRRRRTGLSILGAGLVPIHRRVTANARRLRGRKIA